MKRYRRNYILLLFLVTVLFTLTACREKAPANEVLPGVEEAEEDDTKQPPASPSPDQTVTEGKQKIDIYGMNEQTLESEPATAEIEGEITAEAIVNAVVNEFKTHTIEIGIDGITQENDTVIVSFKQDMAPLSAVGSDVEETILNCISDSLMDNLSTCDSVIFRAEGEAYESGHFAFKIDEVYASE